MCHLENRGKRSMRIIHCADIHLDSALTTHLDKERARSRRKEILDTFRRMLIYASENGVQAVIIAGDLFDSETVSSATVNVVLGEIARHNELEVYYLQGNHDPGKSIFAGKIIPENLHTFEDRWTYYRLDKNAGESGYDNEMLADSNIVLAGIELTADNKNSIYDELSIRESDVNIVTLHGQAQAYGIAQGTEDICLDKLKDRGIDYLALGHIHKPKKENLDHRGIYVYPGCLEGRGFDECGAHGFVLVDIDDMTHELKTKFIPFAYRRLYDVQVDITDAADSHDAADMIAEMLYREVNSHESDQSQALVKITVNGSIDVEKEIDMDYLFRQFEDSFYYMKLEDKTNLKVDQLKYVHDMSLKGEFIRLVLEQDMSEEDKAFIIQTGVRALDGEEVWPR